MKTYIYGRNVVKEAIRAHKNLEALYIQDNNVDMISFAKKNNYPFQLVNMATLQQMTKGLHQGVVAEVLSYTYDELETMVAQAKRKNPIFVMLDGVEDPHNLGAILRTCDACGVEGVILPKNRSVGLNSTVAKVSTGAIEHVKVCQVTNLTHTIKYLKEKGYWIIGAEKTQDSVVYTTIEYNMPIVLILGSEGKGISRLVLEQCDYLVSIPMVGHINSLNVSVACGVLLYGMMRNRKE